MLLWTIQPVSVVTVLKNNSWRPSAIPADTNLHKYEADRKFYLQEDEISMRPPVYCLSYMGNETQYFGVQLMYQFYPLCYDKKLKQIKDYYLIELNVPEKEILLTRPMRATAIQRKSEMSPSNKAAIDSGFAYYADDVCHNGNHMEYIRRMAKCGAMESIIPEIKLRDIVCIRSFRDDMRIKNSHEFATAVTTKYVSKEHIPTFTKELLISGTGYPVTYNNGRTCVTRPHEFADVMQDKYGMQGVYTYMTVKEAQSCVCKSTWDTIMSKYTATCKLHPESDVSYDTTIRELFNTEEDILNI